MRRTADPKRVRILLLVGDLVGANCSSNENKLSILGKLRRYGWEVALAGAERAVRPCAYAAGRGATPLDLDCTVDEIADIRAYDGVPILPGPSHSGWIK